jgi:chemotaxis signal transduction protein
MALAPAELAFGRDGAPAVDVAFSGETVFSPRLLDVPLRARDIQRRLDRLVWNGRVHPSAEANAFSRSLLEEIAATGRKTRDLFERASAELRATVSAGLQEEARCLAGLAADLFDHGLHERVFDGTPPVEAMLRAALPEAEGAIAAFCRADGTVVARTGELPVTLPGDVLALAPGQSWSGVLGEGRQRFVVGASAGQGERASKTAGGEPVIGLVVIPVGTVAERHVDSPPRFDRVTGGTEIATFLIGNQLLGVVASKVIECIEVATAVRVWRGGFAQRHAGFVTWNDMALPLIDIAADVNAAPGAPQRHAIVLQSASHWFGLLVSDLGPVAEMTLSDERGLAGGDGAARLISQLGRAGSVLMPVLSPDAVFGTAG